MGKLFYSPFHVQLVVRYCSEFEPALLSEDEENEDEDAYS